MGNTHWTDNEEDFLALLYRKGWTDYEIANEIGRSYRSVSSKRQQLELNRKATRAWRRWTETEERQLAYLRDVRGLTLAEIGRELDRTAGSVQGRLKTVANRTLV